MPGKRSKSEERERKRLYRQNRTSEQIALTQEKDRKKKKEVWNKKTKEEKDHANNAKREQMKRLRNKISKEKLNIRKTSREEQEQNKERIRKLRADQSEEEKKIERDKLRERMRDLRGQKCTEVRAYDRIVDRQGKRIMRMSLSGKEHLERNLKAKKGMSLLQSEGRLRKFARREPGMKIAKKDELFEWKEYMKTSKKHKEILSVNMPDIVSRINENARLEKEKKQQTDKNRDKGEWEYDGESGEYYWTGNIEPEYDQVHDFPSPPTKEGLEKAREAEKREMIELMKLRKQEIKEKRQKKNEERKKAMETPVTPLPKHELCEYERIREDIIREREEAMEQFKFFEKLEKTKMEIGLYKKRSKQGKRQCFFSNIKNKICYTHIFFCV